MERSVLGVGLNVCGYDECEYECHGDVHAESGY